MDIGKFVASGWDLTWKRAGVFLVAGIVASLLSLVSVGILLAPLFVGLQMMYVRAGRGENVKTGDVFRYLNKTLPLLLGTIVLAVLISLGLILLVIPGLILMAWWMHALPLIADKGLGLGEAMSRSKDACGKQGLLMSIVFLVVIGFISAVGGMAWGIGAIVTTPLTTGALAAAYAARKF